MSIQALTTTKTYTLWEDLPPTDIPAAMLLDSSKAPLNSEADYRAVRYFFEKWLAAGRPDRVRDAKGKELLLTDVLWCKLLELYPLEARPCTIVVTAFARVTSTHKAQKTLRKTAPQMTLTYEFDHANWGIVELVKRLFIREQGNREAVLAALRLAYPQHKINYTKKLGGQLACVLINGKSFRI